MSFVLGIDPPKRYFEIFRIKTYHAQHGYCADFEMRLMDCMEAYGVNKGKEKCEDFISDLRECMFKGKQRQRTKLIRQEHALQYRAGEKKEKFLKTPNYDAF